MTPPRRAFAIGGVVGLIDGFVVLVIPTLAVLLMVLLVFAPPRPAVAAGALVGVGIGMSVPLGIESARCASDSGCFGPDITGWIVASAICLVVGLLLAARAARRSGAARR